MPAPSNFYKYFQANKNDVNLINELKLTDEQTVLLNKSNAELTKEDRVKLKESVTTIQEVIVEIWKEKQPKPEPNSNKAKRLTKAEKAAKEAERQKNLKESAEHLKRFSHIEDALKVVEKMFSTYCLDYSETEIIGFKSKLTTFQTDIDKIIGDKKEERKVKEQKEALDKLSVLEQQVEATINRLKELGLNEKGEPITIPEPTPTVHNQHT